MDVTGRHLLRPFAMTGRGGTQENDVRPGFLNAPTIIGVHPAGRDVEAGRSSLHPFGLLIGYSDDLYIRMLDGTVFSIYLGQLRLA